MEHGRSLGGAASWATVGSMYAALHVVAWHLQVLHIYIYTHPMFEGGTRGLRARTEAIPKLIRFQNGARDGERLINGFV